MGVGAARTAAHPFAASGRRPLGSRASLGPLVLLRRAGAAALRRADRQTLTRAHCSGGWELGTNPRSLPPLPATPPVRFVWREDAHRGVALVHLLLCRRHPWPLLVLASRSAEPPLERRRGGATRGPRASLYVGVATRRDAAAVCRSGDTPSSEVGAALMPATPSPFAVRWRKGGSGVATPLQVT